jgi:hypothetical protein
MVRSLSLPNFPQFLNLKALPEPFNQLVRPLVLASVSLHVALLLTPYPSPPAKPKSEQPKTVKITALPPIKSKSLIKNKLNKFSAKSLFKSRPSPIVQKGLVIQRPTKKMLAQAPNQKMSKPQATPQSVPSVQPVPVDEPNADSSNPMSDFPHFPGAIPGCLGVQSCYETGQSIDIASQHFQQQLPLKKYSLTQVVNDADRKVVQISKGGAQQFLSILSEGKTAVYVLAEKALTLADLQQTVQVPSDFSENIMAQLPAAADGESTDTSPDLFASPTDFFSQLGGTAADKSEMNPEVNAEVDSMKLVRGQTPPQLLSGFFTPSLTQSGYQQPKAVGAYGGGQLYELKKGTFKPFYLNLVPAQDGKGTIVVVWRSKPS